MFFWFVHLLADSLIRSSRKTLALEISSDARLIVRAPNRMNIEKILHLLEEKKAWIQKKQEEMRKKKSQKVPKKFIPNETFLFLGQEYSLQIVQNSRTPLTLEGKFLLAENRLPKAKEIFEQWYRNEAKVMLLEKVIFFAEVSGFRFRNVKINGAKKRWGSCTASGNINFSWRLVLAPEFVVDYVVAHEVAHLREMNHSKKFWKVVESLLPKYKEGKKWLKQDGHVLDL